MSGAQSPVRGQGQNVCFAPKLWLCRGAPYTATVRPWGATQKSGELDAHAMSASCGGAGGRGVGTSGSPSYAGQAGSLRMSHVSMFFVLRWGRGWGLEMGEGGGGKGGG